MRLNAGKSRKRKTLTLKEPSFAPGHRHSRFPSFSKLIVNRELVHVINMKQIYKRCKTVFSERGSKEITAQRSREPPAAASSCSLPLHRILAEVQRTVPPLNRLRQDNKMQRDILSLFKYWLFQICYGMHTIYYSSAWIR